MKTTFLLRFIILLPLVGAMFNGFSLLFQKKLKPAHSSAVACIAPFLAFLLSLLVFFQVKELKPHDFLLDSLYQWISVGKLNIQLSFRADALTAILLLIITGVGTLIHLFSIGYMHEEDERGLARYFAYLNFFLFAMLVLVLGDGLVVMFVGWEGVGLASYLLIGFWFTDMEKAKAGTKAFVVNRIGDLGFLIGIFVLFYALSQVMTVHDSFSFATLQKYSQAIAKINFFGFSVPELACFCLFVGAMGKSAQIPLYIWLPDAMAGPTPVSALIHAATMVTAGVYMIARMHFIFSLAPNASLFIALVGAVTALFAASIALFQNDIKKVLAYSTVSQLGFMFIAVGVGAYSAGIFHLMTHAFFKALLFLGAGAVIYGMHHEQDIRQMGGLWKHMKVTAVTFAIGTLAIIGFPAFSGFFSKDEILWKALTYKHPVFGALFSPLLWLVGSTAALFTAFYMVRLFCLTFLGDLRADEKVLSHLHEGKPSSIPWMMSIPLALLAVLSLVGGWVGIPEALKGKNHIHHWLEAVFGSSHSAHASHLGELIAMALAVSIMAVGAGFAYKWYGKAPQTALQEEAALLKNQKQEKKAEFFQTLYNKYYVDENIEKILLRPLHSLAEKGLWPLDRLVIDGIVHLFAKVAKGISLFLHWIHSGNVKHYLYFMVIGLMTSLLWLMVSSSFL